MPRQKGRIVVTRFVQQRGYWKGQAFFFIYQVLFEGKVRNGATGGDTVEKSRFLSENLSSKEWFCSFAWFSLFDHLASHFLSPFKGDSHFRCFSTIFPDISRLRSKVEEITFWTEKTVLEPTSVLISFFPFPVMKSNGHQTTFVSIVFLSLSERGTCCDAHKTQNPMRYKQTQK